ncbi:5'-nucleotidase C-terminal domain-containing protein [Peptoniphilus equinus]|uniref:5'-nucleotidase C-terminal domain-containing protein n=1 Tax=Peptoniphilus equinus TaxID=3016343 RepID=A0ABY7QUJ8_9FIRM|nr:5'-nucleotidase C-terminal domain-containing protein [Peptoniphilus equinus]WBW50451.1 5'-nucleotidase C-terminal domain-containing protein [Peptoniphilus equinus]
MNKKLAGSILALTLALGSHSVFADTDSVVTLQDLNLLDKTNTPAQLDAELQRDEGLTMILKALGYSQEASQGDEYVKLNPFKDVDTWFAGYGGLATITRISNGTASDAFNPDGAMLKRDFVTFILRALDYPQMDAYNNAETIAKDIKLLDAAETLDGTLTKRDGAKYIERALSIELNNGTGWTLGDYLVSTGAFTKADAAKQSVKLGPVDEEDIHILYMNDFHGGISEETTGSMRDMGMEKMVGYVNAFREKNKNTIVLNGGDSYQGTSDSNLTKGIPVSAMIKAMDTKASAVGNHDFDWGIGEVDKWEKDGNMEFLAANIVDKTTGEPVSWAKPYDVYTVAGQRIGVIGLAHPNTTTLTKRENVKDLEFTDSAEAAQKYADMLRSEDFEGGPVDAVVLLTHLDSAQDKDGTITGTAADVAKKIKGVDLILSSHSHQSVSGEVNGIDILQAYYTGRAVGVVTLDIEDGKLESVHTDLYYGEDIKDKLTKDPAMTKVYTELQDELQPIKGEQLGEAAGEFTHDRDAKGSVSLLGRWTTDVMRKATNAQIAITNGGGLRRTLDAGTITMGDLYEIMPFDNYLVAMDLSGADVRKAIDHGILMPETTDGAFIGVNVEYDSTKPFEQRITKITLEDGTEIKDNDMYRVVINDFMYTGGDGYDFSNAQNVDETYIPIRDMMVDAIKEAKTITPQPIDYIKAVK